MIAIIYGMNSKPRGVGGGEGGLNPVTIITVFDFPLLPPNNQTITVRTFAAGPH